MEAHLTAAIDRLESALIAETQTLRAGARPDFADSTGRKNQSLLELTRMARGLDPAELARDPAVRVRIDALRRHIEENRQVLQLHVDASREISAIISKTIQNDESDGTYGSQIRCGYHVP